MVKLTEKRIAEIEGLRKRFKSGEKITAEEFKSYSAEDMMKGRFNRLQELANQIPLHEQEIARLKGAGSNEAAFEMQNKLNDIKIKTKGLEPNNNPFFDPYGKPNASNKAVERAMEITGSSEPRLSSSRRAWNLGEFNNTIEGQGGAAAVEALVGGIVPLAAGYAIEKSHGSLNPISIPSAGEGSDTLPSDIQLQKDSINALYRKKMLESLK